eukprot:TRINITY_DN1676_c0_g1_i2.p1 TRINITY_DN1676_c0_g1~~TRINITY_DN1676_c0_g1_i2.p1  ORF type:complete len:279 (+),score=59.87 TRINITY_DN1676_c0_g1_i2:113-949(+)
MAASGINVPYPITMMLQRIPSRSNRDDVLKAVHELGFEGTYDFFYLPLRQPNGKSQNYGYAFINFRSRVDSQRFASLVADGQLHVRNRSNEIKVVPAELQGIEKLRKHFQHSTVMKGPAAPIFVADTTDIPRVRVVEGAQANLPATAVEPLMVGRVAPDGCFPDSMALTSPLTASKYSMLTSAASAAASDISTTDAEDTMMLEDQDSMQRLYKRGNAAALMGDLSMPMKIPISLANMSNSSPLTVEIDAERFWGKRHVEAFVGLPNEPLRVPLTACRF